MKCFELVEGRLKHGIGLEGGKVLLGRKGIGGREVRISLPNMAETQGGRLVEVPARNSGYMVVIRAARLVQARSNREWDYAIKRKWLHRPPDGRGPVADGHARWGHCRHCDRLLGRVTAPERPIRAEDCVALGRLAWRRGCDYLLCLRPGEAVEAVYRDGRVAQVKALPEGLRVFDPRAAAVQRLTDGMWGVLQ